MARAKPTKRKADAILTADWHLRDDVPTCRIDDYAAAMWRKIEFIKKLKWKHTTREQECALLVAGDLFHRPRPSYALTTKAMRELNVGGEFIAIPGQHDLPQHRLGAIDESAFGVLTESFIITETKSCTGIQGFPFGAELKSCAKEIIKDPDRTRQIALAHVMCYESKPLFPGAEKVGGTAQQILDKLKGFDLVVTGDNHIPFTYRAKDGRLLVNPGSLMRMTAAQADHRPRVYLWYADENRVDEVFLPIEQGVVSRDHIERAEERDERIDAYVTRMNHDYEVELSFDENLKRYLATNRVHSRVKNIINEARS